MTAVVFDLDGTLVDSVHAIAGVGDALMRERGLAPLGATEARGYVGDGASKFVERALKARESYKPGADFAQAVTRFHTLYAEAPGSENPPFDGVEPFLERLKGRGAALALCTNKPAAPTANVLRALGWETLFDSVVAGDTLDVKKPDPAPLLRCCDEIGVAAPSALSAYVGDSEVDAQTAARAGAPFALFTLGYRRTPSAEIAADLRFEAYDALEAWLAAR